jgi:hypothetical protein
MSFVVSSSVTSSVTSPYEKCGTPTHATVNFRSGAVPVVRYQTAPPAPGFRSSQYGAIMPFGSVEFGMPAFEYAVAALAPRTRKPLDEIFSDVNGCL